MPLSTTLVTGDLKETGGGVSECLKATGDDARGDLDLNPLFVITRLFSTQVGDRIGIPPTPFWMSSFNTGEYPPNNIHNTTHHYKTPLYSPMLVVFNEDIQKGVGGIPIMSKRYKFGLKCCELIVAMCQPRNFL